ncbi:hypothetical protein HNP37_000735 [Flavobacterium nitrogenifigens]|uniref:Uncharacterized protein n=2 Tax=Flavobacterium TaxID=237 RepID=A0A7W7IUB3_9FLAO|nr:hypothetical protein [Flavobacterium nitrogenifigens]MBB6385557.1 hypothetical protein [Flavobacterium notoginsengisoli]
MKKVSYKVALYARENTFNFISYLFIIAFVLFYLGFYLGRIVAK